MNQKKVPQLFVASGASKWGDPQHFPWTMGYQPDYRTEGAIYAKHILATVKDPVIGVLMQNDDYGKDYYDGFRQGLGKDVGRIAKHVTYEINEPTVESQVIQLKASGANVFFNIATPKWAAQAMRKVADLRWNPVQYVNNVAASVGTVMKPAGFDNVQGIITAAYVMDPTDPTWADHPDMAEFKVWMAKYHPSAHLADLGNANGYSVSHLMAETLRRCGDELTRANVMKQAASFRKFRVPLLLPGITVSTSPTDFYPLQAVQLQRFKGETWQLFGDILSAESS
jgi:branched-chain amino acid transport system substrate-binding protein